MLVEIAESFVTLAITPPSELAKSSASIAASTAFSFTDAAPSCVSRRTRSSSSFFSVRGSSVIVDIPTYHMMLHTLIGFVSVLVEVEIHVRSREHHWPKQPLQV